MPRANENRTMTGVRLRPDELQWLAERAVAENLPKHAGEPNRSEMIRLAIAYARQHMPWGWRPEGWRPTS